MKKYIYLAGMKFFNETVFPAYKFLLKSQFWGPDDLEKFQLIRLKELLGIAYSESKFYHDFYNKNDFHPSMIKSLEDVRFIPCITKDELLRNASKIQIRNISEKLIYSETSGSTGNPLVFYRNMEWDAYHRASVLRGYSWYGVEPWEKNAYLWGYNFSKKEQIKTKFFDALQNRVRLFSYNDLDIEKFLNQLKSVVFIRGYSSMIYEIAKKANKMKCSLQPNANLKMILGTSEKIFDKYQVEVKKAFGEKIISEYGAAEAGIIAFECPYGKMHVNMETVLVEEEKKQIIVTNLMSRSFPVIRYKLGDYIELDKSELCPCGMHRPTIKEVTGRVGQVIHGLKETYPSLTLYYVFKNLAKKHNIVLNYQAVQSQKGSLKVNLEGNITDTQEHRLMNEFKKYFGVDLKVKIITGSTLISRDAKKKDFISEL